MRDQAARKTKARLHLRMQRGDFSPVALRKRVLSRSDRRHFAKLTHRRDECLAVRRMIRCNHFAAACMAAASLVATDSGESNSTALPDGSLM